MRVQRKWLIFKFEESSLQGVLSGQSGWQSLENLGSLCLTASIGNNHRIEKGTTEEKEFWYWRFTLQRRGANLQRDRVSCNLEEQEVDGSKYQMENIIAYNSIALFIKGEKELQ